MGIRTKVLPSGLTLETAATRPELPDELLALAVRGWPPFILASDVGERCWPRLFEVAPDLQFGIIDVGTNELVVGGHAAPCEWDGTVDGLPLGWDDVLQRLVVLPGPYETAAVSALSIVVAPEHRSSGLSRVALAALRELVQSRGCRDLIAPVRPNQKHHCPLVPMVDYSRWQHPGGLPHDPWLRVHVEIGGEVLGVAEESMTIDGTVLDWETWTGVTMKSSGTYVVPGALVPVEVDLRLDRGRYVEPNVWVHHRLEVAR